MTTAKQVRTADPTAVQTGKCARVAQEAPGFKAMAVVDRTFK